MPPHVQHHPRPRRRYWPRPCSCAVYRRRACCGLRRGALHSAQARARRSALPCRSRLFADGRCARAKCHSGRDSFCAHKPVYQSALALCLSALVCARPRDRQRAQRQSPLSSLSPRPIEFARQTAYSGGIVAGRACSASACARGERDADQFPRRSHPNIL